MRAAAPDEEEGMERSRPGITFAQLIAFVAVMLPVVAALRFPFSTIDLTYLIRAGNAMLDSGQILRTDTFTFTVVGHAWLNQQWGAEIVFALAYQAGEWIALVLFRAALVGVIFWFEYLACRAAGAGRRAAGWLTLAAFVVCFDGLSLRPNLLGMALFALTLWVVAGRSRRPRLLWLLPAVVLVWANVHGSFVLALAPLGLAWLEDRREGTPSARTTLAVTVACLAATLVTPFGARSWEYVVRLTTDPRIRPFITEWQPTRPTSAIGIGFFVSAAAVAVIAIRHRARLPWPRILGLGLFFVLGIQAVRGVLWWALAAPVLIADLLPERLPRPDVPRALNVVIAAALSLLAIAMLPWFRPASADATDQRVKDAMLLDAPAELVDAVSVAATPGSRLFVAQSYASWFELEMPGNPVFVDPRIELFPDAIWDEYQTVSSAGPGWEAILDRWNVDILVLNREQQGTLIDELDTDDGTSWEPVHRNGDGVVFARISPDGVPP